MSDEQLAELKAAWPVEWTVGHSFVWSPDGAYASVTRNGLRCFCVPWIGVEGNGSTFAEAAAVLRARMEAHIAPLAVLLDSIPTRAHGQDHSRI